MEGESDKNYVGAALRELCSVHRVKFDTYLFNGYWEALKDMKREDFDRALAHVRRHAEWLPKPAGFRAALRQGWM